MVGSADAGWWPLPPAWTSADRSPARCTDSALVLGALAGHDPRDSTSVEVPVPDYAAGLTGSRGPAPWRAARVLRRRAWSRASKRPCVPPSAYSQGLGAEIVEVVAAVDRPRPGDLLHHRARPRRAPTWRATTACKYGRSAGDEDLLDNYLRTRGAGLRGGGEAPDHARHLRPVRRLLRRLLRQGTAGAHPDQGRVRRSPGRSSTRCSRRPRRPSPSRSAPRPTIRC